MIINANIFIKKEFNLNTLGYKSILKLKFS